MQVKRGIMMMETLKGRIHSARDHVCYDHELEDEGNHRPEQDAPHVTYSSAVPGNHGQKKKNNNKELGKTFQRL